jgi:hypothetical protein
MARYPRRVRGPGLQFHLPTEFRFDRRQPIPPARNFFYFFSAIYRKSP